MCAQIKGNCGSAKGFLELVLHSGQQLTAHNKELIEAAISQLQKTINWSHHREVALACCATLTRRTAHNSPPLADVAGVRPAGDGSVPVEANGLPR